ncbi:MAG: protein kinase, partial [Planctomycetota bacterium]
VVHRDVSPANLMLNPDGRRLVVMDFGLARPGAGQADVTAPGGFVGKYRYAAPEQLAGQEIGPPADVRGLGVTLWELLTRRRLFAQGEDARAITALVHERDVPALRAVVPDADRDLEAIVAQAVHRDPNQRTANAGELARHLRLYLEGRALPIRQPGLGELALRWAREHQPLVTGAAAVGVVAASILTWSFWKLEDKNQALQQTNKQLVASRDQAQTNATTARQLATTLFTRVNDSPLFQAALLTADHRNLLRDLIADYQTLLADRLGEDADNAEQAARIRLALAAAQTQADDFTGAQDTLERAAQTIERVADPAIRRDLALDRRLLAMERRLAAGQADTDPQAIARFAQDLYAGSDASPPLPRPETLLGNIAPTNPDDTGPTHPDWRRTAQTERLLARLYRTVAQDDDELRHRHHALLLFQIRHEALTRQPAEDGPTPAQRAALAEARYDWRRAALELSRSYQAVGQPQLAHATAVEVEPRDLQALSPAQLARLGPLDQLIVAEAWSQRADTQPPAPQEDPDNRLVLAAAAYRTALSLTDQAPDDARPRLVALRSAATLAWLSADRIRKAGALDADDPAETLDAFPPPPVPSSARVELQQLALQARAKVAVRQGAAAEARLQAGDPAPAPDLADARAQLAHATGALLVLTAEAQTLAAAHPERLSTLQDEADIARSAAYSLYLLQAYNPEAAEALALQHAGEYSATPVVDAYQRCLDLIDELRNRRDARDLAPNPRVAMLEARARYDYARVLEPLRARASQRQGERNQAQARALASEQTGQLQRAADTLVPFQEPFDYIQVDGLFEQRARIDSARGIFLTRNGDPVEGLMAMVEAERGLAQIRAYSNPAYAQALAQQLDQLGYSDLVVSLAKLAPSLTDSQRQALTAPLSALERFAELRERPGGVQDLRDALTAPPQ